MKPFQLPGGYLLKPTTIFGFQYETEVITDLVITDSTGATVANPLALTVPDTGRDVFSIRNLHDYIESQKYRWVLSGELTPIIQFLRLNPEYHLSDAYFLYSNSRVTYELNSVAPGTDLRKPADFSNRVNLISLIQHNYSGYTGAKVVSVLRKR